MRVSRYTLGKAVGAIASLVALTAVLVVVPWFLGRFTDPRVLLTANWPQLLAGSPDAAVLGGLLGVLGWAAWSYLLVASVLEVIVGLSHHRFRLHLPGVSWLRGAVSTLLVAAAATPTLTAAADPPAPTHAAPSAPASPDSVAEVAARTHTVAPGEELWDIAERELGAGDRWREIATLNPQLEGSTRLSVGMKLALPEVAEPTSTPEARVVVDDGDTLWDIAGRTLGDPERWPEIHALNSELVSDPDQIDVGWVLRLPDAQAPAAKPSPQTVSVKAPAAEQLDTDRQVITDAEPEPSDATELLIPAPAPVPVSAPAGVEVAEVGPSPGEPAAQMPSSAEDEDLGLAAMGAALAVAIVGGVATRRRAQLLGRAVGRRLIPVSDHLASFWTSLAHKADEADESTEPDTSTTVVLGWDDTDNPVHLDLAGARATRLVGPRADSLAAAIVTGLTCSPGAAEVGVVLVGDTQWAEAVDDPRITATSSRHEGITRLTHACSERRLALRSRTLAEAMADPDTADAWAPLVFVFTEPLTGTQPDAVADALALGEVGVHVLVVGDRPLPQCGETLITVDAEVARMAERSFAPQLVPAHARRALIELFTVVSCTETVPAPWWATTSPARPTLVSQEPPMTAQLSSPEHPFLLLLGEVDLAGAAGTPPTRARTSCLEACAWLLSNPGSRASHMTQALLIADSTRRSNLSRLRSWLGADEEGAEYLPDAYSGTIALDPRVSSDWEAFQALLSGGLVTVSDASLRSALRLVRGEPLGTAAFQWLWAETLRTDMVAMIVDAACLLADRGLERGDASLALWAIRRGRLAANDNDELAVREIHALAVAGRLSDVRQEVLDLTRRLRAAGRDLPPKLAIRVQHALQLEPAEASAS